MALFEKYRAKKAAKRYESQMAEWKASRDASAELLALAQNYAGEDSAEIMLKRGEALFASVTGTGLIEDRRGRGQWQGRSSGVSLPIGSIGGRSIRYHVGASKGHFAQGAAMPTAIDFGTVFITNQRVVFQGAKQTRECRYDKMIGVQHTPDGSTIFSVSNRQKPTTVHYGPELTGWFDFRLDLALAHYRDDVPTLITQLQQDLAAVDAAKPTPLVLPSP